MSWYLCERLRLYPLTRLKVWLSGVYWPCMPVFTPYTTSVLLLLRWEGGLLGCKHKLHLCMLGTNSTLIKSDGLGRNMPNSLLQRPAVVMILMFSCSAVLWGAASGLAVGFLRSCGNQPPFLMSQPTSLYLLYYFDAVVGDTTNLSAMSGMDGPSWRRCTQMLLYATNQEPTRKNEDRETFCKTFSNKRCLANLRSFYLVISRTGASNVSRSLLLVTWRYWFHIKVNCYVLVKVGLVFLRNFYWFS